MLSIEQQQRVSDLADEILTENLKEGASFSEELCNFAIDQAIEELAENEESEQVSEAEAKREQAGEYWMECERNED